MVPERRVLEPGLLGRCRPAPCRTAARPGGSPCSPAGCPASPGRQPSAACAAAGTPTGSALAAEAISSATTEPPAATGVSARISQAGRRRWRIGCSISTYDDEADRQRDGQAQRPGAHAADPGGVLVEPQEQREVPQVDAVGDLAQRAQGPHGQYPRGHDARSHHGGHDQQRDRRRRAPSMPYGYIQGVSPFTSAIAVNAPPSRAARRVRGRAWSPGAIGGPRPGPRSAASSATAGAAACRTRSSASRSPATRRSAGRTRACRCRSRCG